MMWRKVMAIYDKLLHRNEKIDLLDADTPTVPKQDMEHLRAYDRELKSRLRSLEVDADVIGRRRMTASGGESNG
jgi:hypothetical protein